MRKKIKELYEHSTLVAKIRYSYLCLLVPFVLFLIFCFYNLWNNNRRYEDMINSSVMASQFSLDFQKDFDYETYLLIVGNKTLEESSLHDMLVEADDIVAGLEELTESQENLKRLTSVKKYLNNLETYIGRIEDNIREGNRYEDNMEIWENDVQIVTSLVGDTMSQYIYYEIRGIQNGSDYVIFSNEEAVRAKAAELKKEKESGNPVDAEEIISQLANIIVCLQPRVEASQSAVTSAVDKVIVNNPKNVQTNLFLVEQTPSAERIDSFTDESTGFNPYSSWNNNYKAAFELRETWPGWMSSAGASIDSACRLRTNLIDRSNTEYIFNDLSVSGAAGNAVGDVAKDIMGADGGLTPTERRNRIYDMRVQVYSRDTIGVQSPVLTMTGTVIE